MGKQKSKRKSVQSHETAVKKFNVGQFLRQRMHEHKTGSPQTVGDYETTQKDHSDSQQTTSPEVIIVNASTLPQGSFRKSNHSQLLNTAALRSSPLPKLLFAKQKKVWQAILEKEHQFKNTTSPNALDQHPELTPKMRTVLFDWLIEVSEQFKLYRESFYLAADYVDRYLAATNNFPKINLQLLGITCLFLAAKVEGSLRDLTVKECADVTAKTYTASEIIKQELLVLHTLKWELLPLTPCSWANLYLKILNYNFDVISYAKLMAVLDMCMLDINSLKYSYSVLAAAALHHKYPEEILLVSRYLWEDIRECVEWMFPFKLVLNNAVEKGGLKVEVWKDTMNNAHNVQTRVPAYDLVCQAYKLRQEMEKVAITPPSLDEETPPQSTSRTTSAILVTSPPSDEVIVPSNVQVNASTSSHSQQAVVPPTPDLSQVLDLLQSQTHAVVLPLTDNQIQTNSLPRILDLSEVINIIQRNPHVIGLQPIQQVTVPTSRDTRGEQPQSANEEQDQQEDNIMTNPTNMARRITSCRPPNNNKDQSHSEDVIIID